MLRRNKFVNRDRTLSRNWLSAKSRTRPLRFESLEERAVLDAEHIYSVWTWQGPEIGVSQLVPSAVAFEGSASPTVKRFVVAVGAWGGGTLVWRLKGTATGGVDLSLPQTGTRQMGVEEQFAYFDFVVDGEYDDAQFEGTESAIFTLDSAIAADGTVYSPHELYGQATVYIEDNEHPTVSIASTSDMGESGTPGAFTVSIEHAVSHDLAVNYSLTGSTATAGQDFQNPGGAVTIPAGQTSQSFTITPINDCTYEGTTPENVVATLLDTTYYDLEPTASTATISVIDNESFPAVRFDNSGPYFGAWYGSEPLGTNHSVGASFTVNLVCSTNDSLPGLSTEPVTLSVTITGTAQAPGDYSAPSEITFAPNDTSEILTVTVLDDSEPELDETFLVNARSPSGFADQMMGTISDDDVRPVVRLEADSEAIEGQPLEFTLTLSHPFDGQLSVPYSIVGITTSGDDYSTAGPLVAVFGDNETTTTITIATTPDGLGEQDETFKVELLTPNDATLDESAKERVGTILDDEPRLSVTSGGLPMEVPGNTSTGNFRIAVTRRSESQNPPTIPPFTAEYQVGGAANNVLDLIQLLPGQVTIDGDEEYIYFAPRNDNLREGSEALTLTLVAPSGSSYSVNLAQSQAMAVIQDNDMWQVKVQATDEYAFETDNDLAVFTVTRINETDTTYPLTVYFLPDGTATQDADYQYLGENVTIPAGATTVPVIVYPNDDGNKEPDESVILAIQPNDYYAPAAEFQATAWIQDNDKSTPTKKCTPCDDRSGASGEVTASAAEGNITYGSGANPHPIVSVDVSFVQDISAANSIEVQLTFGGIIGPSVYYDPSTLVPFTPYHFALMADATTLPSGSHSWEMRMSVHFASGLVSTHTYSGQMAIANRIDSEFGNRWWHRDVDRLYPGMGGATIISGMGNGDWFEQVSPGVYEREAGEYGYSTLTFSAGQYVLRSKHGMLSVFNSNGILTSKSDPLGNTTTFTYIDADNDGVTDEIKTIVDPRGRTTTFNYSGARVDSITDFAGRVTTLSYTNGYLTTISSPDPDGNGQQPAPIEAFAYSPTTGLMTSHTDADDRTTTFQYRADRTLQKRTYEDNTFQELTSSMNSGVVDLTTGVGYQQNPAPLLLSSEVLGMQKDENGKITKFTTNRFGQIIKEVDALGNVTIYERDDEGNVTKIVRPDPDGPGPQSADENYEYDSLGNMTSRYVPGGGTEEWTYDYVLNLVQYHTDRDGYKFNSVYDYTTGLLLRSERIIGLPDWIGGALDDLKTFYTYTSAPINPGDPPAGLLETETDPLGRVTRNEYDEDGNLIAVTYADGTSDEASVSYEYDAAGNMTASIDELGRRTSYEYDALDRLVTMTLPDPDGAGQLAAPIYRYEYNGNNQRTREIDPLERSTLYVYNDRGSLASVIRPDHDGDGNLTITGNAYDDAQRLTSTTDPIGRVTAYGYNDNNWQTSTTLPDPDGPSAALPAPVLHTEYDVLGRVSKTRDALNNETLYSYQINGSQVVTTLPDPDGPGQLTGPVSNVFTYKTLRKIVSTDAAGAVTTQWFDDADRLIKVTEPDPDGPNPALQSPETLYSYDRAGNLRYLTDARGKVTEYVYDNRNRLVLTIGPDPDGPGPNNPLAAPQTIYTYDDAGQLLKVTDPLLRETTYEYDGLGRLVKVVQPDPDGAGEFESPETLYEYDIASRLVKVTDTTNKVTTYGYNALDNLTTVTAPDPNGGSNPVVTTYAFDAAGQLKTVTDAQGGLTTYEYDNLGRVKKVLYPAPNTATPWVRPFTEYTYYADGSLKEFKDENSNTTTQFYDNLRRLTSRVDAEGGTTTYTYDSVNNLTSLEDPEANVTTWQYDKLRRVTLETNELGKTRSFKYDAAGNLTDRIDRLGRRINLEYDALGRNTFERWYDQGNALVRTIGFTYDAASQMTQATDPTGTYSYEYDKLGRAKLESQSFAGLSPLIQYNRKFNAASSVTELTATIGGAGDFKNSYLYDDLQRLTRVTQEQYGDNAVAAKRVDFTYTATGQFEQVSRYADVAGTQHVASSHYLYDGMHRLEKLVHSTSTSAPLAGPSWGDNPLAGYQFVYDPASRIQQIISFKDGVSTYTYDLTNQLTGADHDNQYYSNDESYAYDTNGNRTGGGYQTSANNQLASDGTYSYEYDDEGNRTKRTNIATGLVTTYEWDHRNRLITATDHTWPHEPGQEGVDWGWGPSGDSGTIQNSVDPANEPGSPDAVGSGEAYYSTFYYDYELNEVVYVVNYTETFEVKVVHAVEGGNIDIYVRFVGNALYNDFFYFVDLTTSTASDVDDFSPVSGEFYLDSTEWTLIASIATTPDNLVEGNETITVGVRPQEGGLQDGDYQTYWGGTTAYVDALIVDNEWMANYGAGVQAAMEGNDIVLTITADGGPLTFEYWVEDVGSAVRNTDYLVDPNDLNVFGGTIVVDLYQDGVITFHAIDDLSDETTQSFKIYVQIVGRPDTLMILEADILDNDAPTYDILQTVENSYDVFNRLVRRRLDADGEGPNVAVDRYFSWEDNQIALQFEGNQASNLSHRYLWGPAVDQILADENVTWLTQPGPVLWPLADQLGTPRDIAAYDAATDTTAIVNHRIFDSFGVMVSQSDTNFSIAIGFTGVYFETATGYGYHRHRWYDMETGRWLSEDPIAFEAGDSNLTRYVENSPTNATDPSGLITVLVEGILTDSTNTNAGAFIRGMRDAWAKNGMAQQKVVYYDFPQAWPADAWLNDWKISTYNRQVAADLAAFVRQLRKDYPGEQIRIVAMSNGTTITTLALESGMQVNGVVFIGAALQNDHDMTKALKNTPWMRSYWSEKDEMAGKADGAGRKGFARNYPTLVEIKVNQMKHASGTKPEGIALANQSIPPFPSEGIPFMSYYMGYTYVHSDCALKTAPSGIRNATTSGFEVIESGIKNSTRSGPWSNFHP